MRLVSIIFSLLAATCALPQQPDLNEQIRKLLVSSDQNPCGARVQPSSCTCPGGASFIPGQTSGLPCGSSNPTCTCPDGRVFTPNTNWILNMVRNGLLSSTSPHLPEDTLVSGNPPIAKSQGAGAQRFVMEAIGTRLSFSKECGSNTARPTCNCKDGSRWRHPYFIALCSDGSNRTTCTCPDGTTYRS